MSSSSSSSSSIKPQPLAEKLLAVMESENRPFAFADIHERVGKATAKHLLLKCIDLHVANHRIIEKTYGKQKIYCFNNKLGKVNSEAQQHDFRKLEENIQTYTKSIRELQPRIAEIEGQLKIDPADVPLSIPLLQAQHDALAENVNKLQSRADEMKRRDGPPLDPREFEKLQKTRDNNLREFEKRKRLCLNIIGEIMEGYPGTKQKLIKDTEIETDEAAGFDVNQYK